MSTSFSLLVTGCPTNSQAHISAIRFIHAALQSGHLIKSVFFYQDAVNVANKFIIKPNDELQLTQNWIELAKQNQFELQVCVAAANRRGVISKDEAAQNGFENESIEPNFSTLGLGQLAVALAESHSANHQQIQFK